MKAKFPGWCRHCKGKIAVGDDIGWRPGEGAWHQQCPLPVAAKPRTSPLIAAKTPPVIVGKRKRTDYEIATLAAKKVKWRRHEVLGRSAEQVRIQ